MRCCFPPIFARWSVKFSTQSRACSASANSLSVRTRSDASAPKAWQRSRFRSNSNLDCSILVREVGKYFYPPNRTIANEKSIAWPAPVPAIVPELPTIRVKWRQREVGGTGAGCWYTIRLPSQTSNVSQSARFSSNSSLDRSMASWSDLPRTSLDATIWPCLMNKHHINRAPRSP